MLLGRRQAITFDPHGLAQCTTKGLETPFDHVVGIITLDLDVNRRLQTFSDRTEGMSRHFHRKLPDSITRDLAFEPFVQPMTSAQETFILNEVSQIITAMDNLFTKVGEAGATAAHVDTLIASHEDRQTFLDRFIGEMEDVDMADAATRFQQAQTALDVSARTFSSLSQVSLLPFLR